MQLSIVIPVYNSQRYVKECLDSLVSNKLDSQSVEIILVDDGSSDLSGNICEQYAHDYEYIKSYRIKNSGQAYARNYGTELAKGNWVTYLDSDDVVVDGYIQTLLSLLNRVDKSSILMFRFSRFKCLREDASHRLNLNICNELRTIPKDEAMVDLTLSEWGNYLWNKVFPSKIVKETKLPINSKLEDRETLYKYFEAAASIVVLDEVLYFYRETENSVLNANSVQGKFTVMEDDITSIVHQMTFFKNNGYVEAYKREKAFLYRQALYFIMFVKANDLNDEGEQYKYCLQVLASFNSEFKYMGLKWYAAMKLYQIAPSLLLIYSKIKLKVHRSR
ncbi:glycosyltransferase family 2 protein [Limosilactobacillus fermentum]|uniref:glycosyltransferase family 2 protein n=1 Tax=Limosilactobacillus fermentum TaxID=1613 RepID=UPI0030EF6921